jgi:hypothetical protein
MVYYHYRQLEWLFSAIKLKSSGASLGLITFSLIRSAATITTATTAAIKSVVFVFFFFFSI